MFLNDTNNPSRTFQLNCISILFIVALLATLASGGWLWLSRMAWVLIAMLIMMNSDFAFYTIAFYFSFFHSSGFLNNSVFTLKHFHLAFVLLLLIKILKGWRPDPHDIKLTFFRSPSMVLFIVLVCGLSNYIHQANAKDYYFLANITSLYVMIFALAICLSDHDKPWRLLIPFYLFGGGVQILIGFLYLLTHWALFKTTFDTHLLHNNHVGILCGMSLYYCFPWCLKASALSRRLLAWALLLLFLGGLLFSCSRTAWFAWAVSFFVFIYRLKTFPAHESRIIIKNLLVFLFFCLVMVPISSVFSDTVAARIALLPQLFSAESWGYTLADSQNFGFFGISRLQQLFVIKQTLLHHALFGVGLCKQVRDFHGLIFVIFSGAGIFGLISLAAFCFGCCRLTLRAQYLAKNFEHRLVLSAVLASLVFWMVVSIMETMIVQFFVWFTVLMLWVSTHKGKFQNE